MYYEVLLDGDMYALIAAGKHTHDQRVVVVAPTPTLSAQLMQQSKARQSSCHKYTLLDPDLNAFCTDVNGRLVALLRDLTTNVPLTPSDSLADIGPRLHAQSPFLVSVWTNHTREVDMRPWDMVAGEHPVPMCKTSTLFVPRGTFLHMTVQPKESFPYICSLFGKQAPDNCPKRGTVERWLGPIHNVTLPLGSLANETRNTTLVFDVSGSTGTTRFSFTVVDCGNTTGDTKGKKQILRWEESLPNNHLIPRYNQFTARWCEGSGCRCASGCGATAWAMSLGYLGRSGSPLGFRRSIPQPGSDDYVAWVTELRRALNTQCLSDQGYTWLGDMTGVPMKRYIDGQSARGVTLASHVGDMNLPWVKDTVVLQRIRRGIPLIGVISISSGLHYPMIGGIQRWKNQRSGWFDDVYYKYWFLMGWGGSGDGWQQRTVFTWVTLDF
jgi:hypothetical protein